MREIPYNHEPGNLPPSIERISFLSGFDGACLDGILSNTKILECDAGDMIIREGDPGKELFILLRGRVAILKGGQEVARLDGAGELLGELALLNGKERSATVTSLGRAYCLKIDPHFLETLSKEETNAYYAVLYRFVAMLLAERLAETSKRVVYLEKRLGQAGIDTVVL